MTKIPLSTTIVLLLVGCNTHIQPLPQEGPSSAQIWHGERESVTTNYANTSDQRADSDKRLFSAPITMSAKTTERLRELNRHFKRVPNPEILGYVAPHFNTAQMPVPGYFTVFRLYKKDGYALRSEDAATGVSK